MSNQRQEYQTPYIPSGTALDYNEPILDGGNGNLGARWYENNGKLQIVQLDSGATSATPTGAQATGQPAYWKDRGRKIVTNDQRFAAGDRNALAGVFVDDITPGYYCAIQIGGPNMATIITDGNVVEGDTIIANAAGTASFVPIAEGTAPTHIPLGVALADDVSTALAVKTCNISVPEVN